MTIAYFRKCGVFLGVFLGIEDCRVNLCINGYLKEFGDKIFSAAEIKITIILSKNLIRFTLFVKNL